LDGRTPEEAYEEAVGEIERLVSLLEQPSEHAPVDVPRETPEIPFTSNMTKEAFLANVERAKKYITAGDIIQVVGSQRFSTPVKASPVDLYRAARSINPSPYMFLLELEGFSLVGASPEIHVRCEDRRVEIRPIAGTRRAGARRRKTLALEKELLADPKERAEHVMLVDLARNDIGRVCDFGSVQVKDLMIIERYSHVMHIVSQVEGRLAEGRTPYDLMRATFPAGTLSGAPKIRAMQIIAELEQTARGPYGGCMGYFSFNGNLDCCITIRTALLKDGQAYVQAGGGWVNDSTPEAEFQETVNKAKAMLKAVAMAENFMSKKHLRLLRSTYRVPAGTGGQTGRLPQLRRQNAAGRPAFARRHPHPQTKDPAEREAGSSPAAPLANRIIDNIEKVIVGKRAKSC
jgi:anthranilate synthase component I